MIDPMKSICAGEVSRQLNRGMWRFQRSQVRGRETMGSGRSHEEFTIGNNTLIIYHGGITSYIIKYIIKSRCGRSHQLIR